MAQVRDILSDVKKIDVIEASVTQLQTDLTSFEALPSQVNQTGKYLTTNGTDASWGTVTVPTAVSQLTNDSQYQTLSQVSAAIAGLVDSAPGTLNTLNELAAALNDDPNFATSITNMVAGKANLSGGTFTGNVTVNGLFEVKDPGNYYNGHMRVGAVGQGYPYVNIGMDENDADNPGMVVGWYIKALGDIITNRIRLGGVYGQTGQIIAAPNTYEAQWTTIKTVNGTSILGAGDIIISAYTDSKVQTYLTANNYVNTTTLNTALTLKADVATTYTKTQVDSALSNKADTTTVNNALALKADQSTTYTKTQVDTSLGLKANQSTTYTKTEVDTSLALKANLTDLTPTNVSDKSNTSTGYFSLPKGTTAQRPGSVDAGDTRFNTTASSIEVFTGSAWALVGAKDGSSYAAAAPSATYIYDLGIRGKGLFWIQKADGTPIQVYCDLDTVGVDGKGGWMLVGSWATASEWTKDSVSSAAVFGTTALNAFSSNFGNTLMNHMRVKVSTAPDTASNVSQADWYYYWGATPIQWKTVWAAGAGTNNHWNSAGAVNNGASTPRNSLRQFSYAYNIKYTYTANYQTWANLSDSGTSGSTGTEAWYDWYSGLTTPGYTLGVYNAGGAGRGDGSLAITFGGDTSTTAGHDCNFANAKYGYDDTALVAWGGDTGVHNMNGQTGTNGSNNNMWIWIK